MTTPLPLIAMAFVMGVALAPSRADGGAGVVLASCAAGGFALAALGAWRRTPGAARAVAMVLAALLAGLARGAEVEGAVPRARAAVAGGLLTGEVVEGCVRDDDTARCVVVRAGDNARVALSAPARACAALPGERITAVALVRTVAPDANGARLGPGGAMFRRGVRFTAAAAGCERAAPRGGIVGPLAYARRAGLAVRAALGRGVARALPVQAQRQARALLFGDERGIASDELDAFRDSGLAHLLAVSGAHVALLSALLGAVLRALLRRVPAIAARGLVAPSAALAPLPLLAVFVLATGESPSALRALLGAALAAPAVACGRRAHAEALVAASAIGTLAVAPELLRDAGWELSIVAAWALAARAERDDDDDDDGSRSERAAARGVRGHLAAVARAVLAGWGEALATSGRVALAAAPVLAWHFQRAPAGAIAANALAAPLAEAVALPLVLAVALVGLAWQTLGALLGTLAAPLLAALFAMPRVALALPLATLALPPPTPAQAFACVLGALSALRARGVRARAAWALAALLAGAALEGAHLASVHPRGVLRVTVLDVGQGDSVLVDLPDGAAMLVDGGGARRDAPDPGARVVVPALADRRRRSLSVVIASHPHPDHVGGLAAVLGWAEVGALWDTRQGEAGLADASVDHGRAGFAPMPVGAYARLRAAAAARGVVVRGPEAWCGPPRAFHGVVLEVLAPCPAVTPGDAPNDASLVLRLAFGRARVLLAGDLERAGEGRLIARLRRIQADEAGSSVTTVLKVAHHGSRTSSTEEFLDAVRPRVALVSAGHPSPFDHPHAEALARLRAAGATVRSTSTEGALSATVWPDGRVATERWAR